MSGHGAPPFSEKEIWNPVSWFESYARKTRHSMPNIVWSEDAFGARNYHFQRCIYLPNSSVTAIAGPVFYFRDDCPEWWTGTSGVSCHVAGQARAQSCTRPASFFSHVSFGSAKENAHPGSRGALLVCLTINSTTICALNVFAEKLVRCSQNAVLLPFNVF